MPKYNYDNYSKLNNLNNYSSFAQSDLFTTVYEQQKRGQTQKNSKVVPIKRKKKAKRNNLLKNIIVFSFFSLLLFYILPYSYKNFVANTYVNKTKTVLNIDYYNFLYPTHSYLNKDLFLGKYPIKDTEYKKPIMVNVKESYEKQTLKYRLLQLQNEYKRIKPSIYIWDYEDNSYVNIDADEAFPAASIIKLPVLLEMFREIEQGKFKLNDTMVLEDYYRASGSGKLQYSQGGVEHTMDYLARIMIENSDNSSTNMIISKMGGMPQVNSAIKHWGLKTTHINNWLPDLPGTNLTTTRELVKMLYNINSTDIISIESKRKMADYLSHVKNNRLLKAGLPKEAILLHKTGDIGFMLGDAGIVKTPSGKRYIVAILVKRPYNNHQGKDFIVKASKIIYDTIQN